MEGPYRVFIVEHDKDSLEMLELLVEQESRCAVQGGLAPASDNIERIRAFGPDLVILDFIPRHTENWRLLDRLRVDEATSSVPVLALSTSEPVVEQTLVSFNVRRTLIKPFDLDVLSKAVQDILSQPKVQVPAAAARSGAEQMREAADILVENAREIVGQWLQRVSEIEPFKSEKRLRPRALLNEMPMVLWGTAVGLRTGLPESLFEEGRFFHTAALAHAMERRRQHVGLDTPDHLIALPAAEHSFNGATPFQAWIPQAVYPIRAAPSGFNGATPFQAWIPPTRWRRWHGCSRFNGATPFQAWIRAYATRPRRCGRRFNGATPFQAWIQVTPPSPWLADKRFNGATPFQAWIHARSGGPTRRCDSLQWCHAFSGMDTRP